MSLRIESLEASGFDRFLVYLNDHLRDNGAAGTGYFQPLSREASVFPPDRADAFYAGLTTPVGTSGWRRAWVALGTAGQVAGHVDLRGHPEPHSAHRCLLGMGVDRGHRQRGLGSQLLAHAEAWAREQRFEWLDLQVLGSNAAALALYASRGFQTTGVVPDRFRIDGQGFAYASMSLCLG